MRVRRLLLAERAALACREVEVEVVAVGLVGVGAEHRAEGAARADMQPAQEEGLRGRAWALGAAARGYGDRHLRMGGLLWQGGALPLRIIRFPRCAALRPVGRGPGAAGFLQLGGGR